MGGWHLTSGSESVIIGTEASDRGPWGVWPKCRVRPNCEGTAIDGSRCLVRVAGFERGMYKLGFGEAGAAPKVGVRTCRMRYHLIDRVLDVDLGKSLRASKQLTLGEEYLADHFPTFPVMPGVLMLQALVEAGSWLVRFTRDFNPSVLALREAKNVKYGSFFAPGNRMTATVEWVSEADGLFCFKGRGEVNGQTTVAASFSIGGYNLRDRHAAWADRDAELVKALRSHGEWLRGPR